MTLWEQVVYKNPIFQRQHGRASCTPGNDCLERPTLILKRKCRNLKGTATCFFPFQIGSLSELRMGSVRPQVDWEEGQLLPGESSEAGGKSSPFFVCFALCVYIYIYVQCNYIYLGIHVCIYIDIIRIQYIKSSSCIPIYIFTWEFKYINRYIHGMWRLLSS